MTILLTGIAGFIAARTASMLLEQGHEVVGVDNLNAYYDVRLKAYRVCELARQTGADPAVIDALDPICSTVSEFTGPLHFRAGKLEFHQLDIENKAALKLLFLDLPVP